MKVSVWVKAESRCCLQYGTHNKINEWSDWKSSSVSHGFGTCCPRITYAMISTKWKLKNETGSLCCDADAQSWIRLQKGRQGREGGAICGLSSKKKQPAKGNRGLSTHATHTFISAKLNCKGPLQAPHSIMIICCCQYGFTVSKLSSSACRATLTHIFKNEVNVLIILCSDDIQEFDNVGVISKLLHKAKKDAF